jgi:hypothetical protein
MQLVLSIAGDAYHAGRGIRLEIASMGTQATAESSLVAGATAISLGR